MKSVPYIYIFSSDRFFPVIIFRKLCGFKDCHFGQFGTINGQYILHI